MKEAFSKDITQLDVFLVEDRTDAVDNIDLQILAWLSANKQRILEIGTRHGQSTINLAKFSPPDAKVYSIDIDQSQDKECLKKLPCFNKITFIEADSASFDFKSLNETFDLIFIDGDHSYHGVLNDTKKALSVLRPGGLILWHDFISPPVLLAIYGMGLSCNQLGNYFGYSYGKIGVDPDLRFSQIKDIGNLLQKL